MRLWRSWRRWATRSGTRGSEGRTGAELGIDGAAFAGNAGRVPDSPVESPLIIRPGIRCMRSRLISLFLFVLAPLAHAAQPVTVDQLEKILSSDHRVSDARLASHLAGLTITERVTAERLAAWQAQFPGIRTKQMLRLLADESAFYPCLRRIAPPRRGPALPTKEKSLTRLASMPDSSFIICPTCSRCARLCTFRPHSMRCCSRPATLIR